MTTDPEFLLVDAGNAAVLQHVAPEVFDGAIDPRWTAEFIADARHHLIVAVDDGVVVGMVSAVDYVHPDKAAQLWINELGVAPTHQRRGIGLALVQRMLAHGRSIGCTEAWVGTEVDNGAARSLYERAGGEAEMFVLYFFPFR